MSAEHVSDVCWRDDVVVEERGVWESRLCWKLTENVVLHLLAFWGGSVSLTIHCVRSSRETDHILRVFLWQTKVQTLCIELKEMKLSLQG